MTEEIEAHHLIQRIIKATQGRKVSLVIKIDAMFGMMMTCLYIMTDPDAPPDIKESTAITYGNLRNYLLIVVPSVFDDLEKMERDMGVFAFKV